MGKVDSSTMPPSTEPELTDGPMLYSASALRVIEDLKEQLGRRLKQSALDRAREQGRALIAPEDVWAIVDQFGGSILDEASPNGR